MVNPEHGKTGTSQFPLNYMFAKDGVLEFEQLSSDPASPNEGEMWIRWDETQLRYYDGSSVRKVPILSSAPSSPYLTVTAGGSTYYIDLESKASADHPNLAVDGAIGSGQAVTGAVNTGVIDDFEDNGIDEFSGETFAFSVVDSGGGVVYNGTYALRHPGSSQNGIESGSGLENYPSPGDTFECRIYRASDGNDGQAFFEYGGTGNSKYEFGPRNDSEVRFIDRAESSVKDTASWSGGNFRDEWLRLEVDWGSGGTHTGKVFDASDTEIVSLSMTDSDLTGQGVGFAANGDVSFDYARII